MYKDVVLQAAEPKKAPKGRKGRRAAVAEAEAADMHAEEIEVIDDEDEGADLAVCQVCSSAPGIKHDDTHLCLSSACHSSLSNLIY